MKVYFVLMNPPSQLALVTIVIPCLNEIDLLPGLKSKIADLSQDQIEFILIDAGSVDGSKEFLRQNFSSSCGLDSSDPSNERSTLSIGQAFLQGAELAQTTYLALWPIDVAIEAHHIAALKKSCQMQDFDYFFFKKSYSPDNFILKIFSFLQNTFWSGFQKQFVWTHFVVVKRSILQKSTCQEVLAQGFLDDVRLSDFLRKSYLGCQLPLKVSVSSRKYQKDGIFKRLCSNAVIMILFRLGCNDFELLRKFYRNETQLGSLAKHLIRSFFRKKFTS